MNILALIVGGAMSTCGLILLVTGIKYILIAIN
jgi:hypothetical protein